MDDKDRDRDRNREKQATSLCRTVQENYESASFPNLENNELEHLASCIACRNWKEDIDSLTEMAESMPKFDVSESLTQKILASVNEEERERRSLLQTPLAICLLSAFAWLLLFQDSLESIWGLGSWLLALVTIAAFKFLLVDGSPRENLQKSL